MYLTAHTLIVSSAFALKRHISLEPLAAIAAANRDVGMSTLRTKRYNWFNTNSAVWGAKLAVSQLSCLAHAKLAPSLPCCDPAYLPYPIRRLWEIPNSLDNNTPEVRKQLIGTFLLTFFLLPVTPTTTLSSPPLFFLLAP